jgi:hypothetical protein
MYMLSWGSWEWNRYKPISFFVPDWNGELWFTMKMNLKAKCHQTFIFPLVPVK